MDRFQEMQVFLAAADEQSFAAAARRLNMSPPTVTRAIAGLEARIGTQLLTRNTRTVRLTEAGQRYVEDCRRILAELEEAEESAMGSHSAARGLLHVTAPVLFGEQFITPLMVRYMQAQPAVSIRALLVDRVVNMIDEGVDVAVRIGDLPDTGMESVCVGSVRRVVCGSPDYLARMGTPSRPEQLSGYRLALSNSNQMSAQFVDRGKPLSVHLQPQLLTSTMQAAINAACSGWGLTRVLSYQIATQLAEGSLQIVLDAFEPPPLPINIVCQNPGKQTARVRSFVDFCVEELRREPALNSINAV